MKITKLLVANRGEIAVRIFRTCQELGIRTVAVCSKADRDSVHAQMADELVEIGDSEPASSYLRIEKILAAAKETGADAVHPGYGFLSERAEFSQACQDAGVIFVGPGAAAMRKLGDKISAKTLAQEAGVPIVPGYFAQGATLEDLASAADTIGYPVMLKASAGGGGRGMRVVHAPSELASAHALAVQEAVNAFGDGEMMLERYISNPRHIEVQVAADAHGKVVCLFERECSMQRRNQKMIEEAPAPPVVSGLVNWSGLRTAASAVVAKATYTSLGTVEFIVDPTTGDFFFLEVNARLQVEHPVTEAITGLDLVALQLAIAEGGRLSLAEPLMVGNRVAISGHAMEVRVLAEDPSNGFRPSTGKILTWSFPTRPGVRLDTGFEAGKVVSPYYDSLLAKVIAHGATREAAIAKLVATLEEFHVLGVSTNIGLLIELLTDPEFQAGRTHTGLLGEILEGRDADPIPGEVGALAELAGVGVRATDSRGPERQSSTPTWELNDRFRIGGLG